MSETIHILEGILRTELRLRMKRDAPQIPPDIFELHIIPDTRPNFHAKGGTCVNIYVSGLNIVGGPTKPSDKQFWKDLVRFTRICCKKLWEPRALVARELLVTIREGRLKTLQFKRDIAERIPGLLEQRDIKVVKEVCTTTWKALGFDATITIQYDSKDYNQTLERARTYLSQRVRETMLEEVEAEIKAVENLLKQE